MADEEASTTAVLLRIHYTFDVDHKIPCLWKARQKYDVQTAPLDDGTVIGIIDLRTCLDLVLCSSPEITANHDVDYTVYAYDYSEDNTPLVSQGALSKVLSEDESFNEAMITGKVTKNAVPIVAKQALDVKLRFTPVSSSWQRGRSGSMSSVTEGMQSQWSNFSQVGPGEMQRAQSPIAMSQRENVHRMLQEGGPRRESSFGNSFAYSNASRPSSRPGTPTNTQPPYQLPLQPGSSHSRRNSHFVFEQPQHSGRRDSFSGYYSGEENFEEGPARKRARTTKVRQMSKSDFNIEQRPNSLRAAATAAQSVRLHKPTPVNPTAALQQGMCAEEPVRPPTPVPRGRQPTGRPRGRPPKKSRLTDQRDASIEPSSPTPQHLSQPQFLQSTVSSPEETRHHLPPESVTSTPAPLENLPSSPPDVSNDQQLAGATTSPMQSVAKYDDKDSGFMSGNVDDLFGDDQDISNFHFSNFVNHDMDNSIVHQVDGGIENAYTPVFEDGESTFEGPTPRSDLPQMPPPPLQNDSQPRETGDQFQRPLLPIQSGTQGVPLDKNGRPIPTLLPRPPPGPFSRSQSMLPQVPASDPGTRSFHRSNTWTPDMSDAIMSDAGGSSDPNKSKTRKRVGKEQTKARLENALATGDMPPYCHNCGAIETPAWRRGYIKYFTCPIDDMQISQEPGELCYKQIVETASDGKVTKWKGWKVEKKQTSGDEDWQQICLCNPCGLWFHKSKCPRPPEKWQKKDPKERKKRKRPPKPPKSRTNPPRHAAGNVQSDAQEPPSEDSSPAETSMEDVAGDNADAMTVNDDNSDDREPELPPMPMQTRSAQMARRTVMFAADTRRIQSSPVTKGTAAEPINIDLTPKPLRRMLFPSPGTNKDLDVSTTTAKGRTQQGLLPSFVRRSPRFNKVKDIFAVETTTPVTITVDGEGKENVTTRVEHDDSLDDLFGDNDADETMLPPATPTPKRRSERILMRTPGRTPSREFGAEISNNVQSASNGVKTPTPKAVDLMAELFMDPALRGLDPTLMTPFSRSLHAACFVAVSPKTPRRARTGTTPKNATPGPRFDWTDLPRLATSSPISWPQAIEGENDWSELPTERMHPDFDDILVPDISMPSSPPVGDEWEDLVNIDQYAAVDWSEFEKERATEAAARLKTPKKQKTALLDVVTPGSGSLRRSPRWAGRE